MAQFKETATLQAQRGFTLIELSIVLVIIGLIVGGVLSGQDLIKAAEVRATIKQVESFNLAANTFRVKYNAIPGDYSTTLAGAAAGSTGNGDGVLLSSVPNILVLTGELSWFWNHLSAAAMIDGGYDGSIVGGAAVLGSTIPTSKLGRASGWHVFSVAGVNYFQLGAKTQANTTIITGAATTANEAFLIDTKMDDGKPNGGVVVAKNGATLAAVDTTGALLCVSAPGTVGVYNIALSPALCQLRIKASF